MIKKFNSFLIKENTNVNIASDIVYIMSNIIDEHPNLVFKSPLGGDMSYNDFISKNDKYKNFQPIYKAGKRLKSKFTISFNKIKDYNKFAWITDQMAASIDRFESDGWTLSDLKVQTSTWEENKQVYISNIDYHFSKPDEIISDELPKEEDITKIINSTIPNIKTDPNNITVYDNYVDIGFDSIAYDGEIPDNIMSYFQKVADMMGFTDIEYDRRQPWGVRFWTN